MHTWAVIWGGLNRVMGLQLVRFSVNGTGCFVWLRRDSHCHELDAEGRQDSERCSQLDDCAGAKRSCVTMQINGILGCCRSHAARPDNHLECVPEHIRVVQLKRRV